MMNSRSYVLEHIGRNIFSDIDMGVEPKIGDFTPQNGWFIMENPIKMG